MSRLKLKQPWALAVILALGLYLILTSAFYPLAFLSVFDAKRVLQLLMFTVLLLFVLLYKPLRLTTLQKLGQIPNYVQFTIFSLFVIGFASSTRLPQPGYALVDVSMIFVMIVLVFVVAASRDMATIQFDKCAIFLIAAMGLMVAIQEFMGYLAGWVIGTEFSYERVLLHFANPRFYNQLQTLSIPLLALLPVFFPEKKWIKLTCFTLIGLQWFLVFSTGARGTFVSLITAMIFIAFWLPENSKHWLKYQVFGFAVGAAVYVLIMLLNNVFIPQPGNFFSHSVGRPMMHTSGRSMLWNLSFEDAKNKPILGAGPTRYACDPPVGSSRLPAHPHSFPVRIMGEWGFIALCLLLFLTVNLGLKYLGLLRRNFLLARPEVEGANPSNAALQSILGISVIAGALHACLSGLLIMPASQTTIVLIAGWAISVTLNSEQNYKTFQINKFVLVISFLLAASQLAFAIKEIQHFSIRSEYATNTVRLAPRFWWAGRTCDYNYSDDQG